MIARNDPRWPFAVRVAVVLLLLVVGGLAVRNALALALATTRPETAMRFAPGNAVVLGQAAIVKAQVEQTAAGRRDTAALARRAIAADPTSATALTALGLVTPMAGAGPIMRASEALSRRSLPAQLWLIEEAVTRDDVDGALRHYDTALRTSRQAPALLFAILVEAVGDEELLPAIARRLSLRPEWGPLFLQQLAQSGTALPNIARLFATLAQLRIDAGDAATGALYARLVEAKAYRDAWSVYAAAHPAARRDGLRPLVLGARAPAPFDWSTGDDVLAQLDRDSLRFAATIEGGVAARQLLLLRPGDHRFRVALRDVEIGEAIPYLRLECAATGKELGRTPLRAGTAAIALRATVPGDCDAQWLSLVVPGSDAPAGTAGTIARIAAD